MSLHVLAYNRKRAIVVLDVAALIAAMLGSGGVSLLEASARPDNLARIEFSHRLHQLRHFPARTWMTAWGNLAVG